MAAASTSAASSAGCSQKARVRWSFVVIGRSSAWRRSDSLRIGQIARRILAVPEGSGGHGLAVALGAALLLGGGLELAAGGHDVAAARPAHRRADPAFEDDLREAPHALGRRTFIARARPGIERDQIDLGRQLIFADQPNELARIL